MPTKQLAQSASPRSPHAPLPRLPAPGHPTRAAIDDWDLLLTALSARLRSVVGPQTSSSAANTRAHRIEHVVLECAEDLDLLHVALCAEIAERRKFELHFRDSNDTVARAIAGLGESFVPMVATADKPRLGKRASALFRIFG